MKGKTRYIFNPEHDLCLANGDMNFIPPFSALRFGRDCAGLTEWVEGNPDEPDMPDNDGESPKLSVENAVSAIVPWGWDPVLKRRLQREGVPDGLLPSDAELEEIRRLSCRTLAAEADAFVTCAVRNAEYCPERPVRAIIDPEKVEDFVNETEEVVLKAPWSGSGKGLRWARRGELSSNDLGWCRNVIAKQGCVMAERREKVVQDFAMLFRIGDCVDFEGYSLFWNENGIYKGNVLASDGWIRGRLASMIPPEVLDRTKEALTEFLAVNFTGHYRGYAGVDMFVYSPERRQSGEAPHFCLAPCVEINVRMTMGLLARRVYDRHLDRGLFRDGKYVLTVEYSPDPDRLREKLSSAVKILSPESLSANYGIGIYPFPDGQDHWNR